MTKETKKIPSMSNPAAFDRFYGAKITLVVGEPGSGKTWYCLHHPKRLKGLYLDLEDRYTEIFKHNPELADTPYTNCVKITKDFDVDDVATFEEVSKQLQDAYERGVEMIVLDGISDLRRMAVDKWCQENERKHPTNQGDWGQVNNLVKKVLFRLFNYARLRDIDIVMTAWLVPQYTPDGNPTGKKEPDVKEFIVAKVDEIILLTRSNTVFSIKRGKSPRGPTDTEDWNFEPAEGSAK